MRVKWLSVLVVLLVLVCWTSVFAGPKGHYGHGDDDIPELMKPNHKVISEKIGDIFSLESGWFTIFKLDRESVQEPSKKQDSSKISVPATRRYPVRSH
jgi:hypothetical protein